MPSPKPRRYLPPVRTSISQECSVMPRDFGTHQRLKSSGFDQASNTRRAGALKVRVTTTSRSDFLTTVVRLPGDSLLLPASIGLLLALHLFENLVQFVEARVPELVVALDPRRDFLQPPCADPAGAYAPDFLGD